MIRNKPRGAVVYGIDIGKTVFHVVGTDAEGSPIQKVKFRREALLQFFERADPALIGMEACPGSQWLARKLQALGHTVRIIPAQFVKPYVKSNKNDLIDAEAIAEAVTRPTMRFVEVKQPEQVDLQALHRVRDHKAPWCMIQPQPRRLNHASSRTERFRVVDHQAAAAEQVSRRAHGFRNVSVQMRFVSNGCSIASEVQAWAPSGTWTCR